MNSIRSSVNQSGMTLIELVIAIAVAGIAVAGLAAAFSSIVSRTADPMIQTQAQVAAESLMEEILLKPFLDPSTTTICPVAPASRADFDNVCDYHNYTSTGIYDQTASQVTGLENYSVTVSVVPTAYSGIASSDALKVSVTVTNPLGTDVVFSAYRTNY